MAGAADIAAAPADAGGTVTQLSLAKDAYSKAVARIGNKRNQTMQQYGYKATGYDNLGNPTGLQVDQYNQYGEYQQMLHDDALASMQATDDSIGRGLGGGPGLGNQAESAAAYAHGQRSYEMGRQFTNDFTDLQDQWLSATQDFAQAQWEAQRQAALDAINNQQFSPAPYDDPYNDPTNTDTTTTTTTQKPVVPASVYTTPYIAAAQAAAASGYSGYVNSAGQTESQRALAAARKILQRN